jgi:hypothetical protein
MQMLYQQSLLDRKVEILVAEPRASFSSFFTYFNLPILVF